MKTLQIQDRDIQFTEITDKDALAQRVRNRLLLYLGEWSFDTTLGTDWFSVLGRKPVSTEQYTELIRKQLIKEPLITSIESIEVDLVRTKTESLEKQKPLRTATITYIVNTVYGQITGEI